MANKVKLGKFKLASIAWSTYKKLTAWWKISSVDGEIDVTEFSSLWEVFAEIYEEITDKKLSVKIPEVKDLKTDEGKVKRNIKIREESVEEEKEDKPMESSGDF